MKNLTITSEMSLNNIYFSVGIIWWYIDNPLKNVKNICNGQNHRIEQNSVQSLVIFAYKLEQLGLTQRTFHYCIIINLKMALPRYYANACIDKPESYYDYSSFDLTWGPMDYYEVLQKIGRGKYSEVFDGVNTLNNQKWVIKILKPIKMEKMQREIKILQTLYGGKNIIKLYDMAKDDVSEVTALIFERVNHVDHRILYK